MSKPVGGRGHKAPYATTHMRIPVPVKEKVEQVIEEFRSGNVADSSKLFISVEDAVNAAQQILKQKKSARESMKKLLMSIYGVEVDI
jgi:hypothetical protein